MSNRFLYSAALVSGILLGATQGVKAQLLHSRDAKISFTVSAPAKNIVGNSDAVRITIDPRTADLQVAVSVSSFQFSNNYIADTLNEVIRQRFNSYYMESAQYPEVRYLGKIAGSLNYKKEGKYPVRSQGKLRVHGREREATATGWITVQGKKISVEATLTLQPADYGIRIPPYIGNMYFREIVINLKGMLQ